MAKGVSDKEEVLSFNFEGSSSGICSDGEFTAQSTTIDNFIKDKVSFIKMDIEGWELKALEGAKNHIKNDVPKWQFLFIINRRIFMKYLNLLSLLYLITRFI